MLKRALICGVDSNSIGLKLATALSELGYATTVSNEGKFNEGNSARLQFEAEQNGNLATQFESVDFTSRTSVSEFIERLRAEEYDVVVCCSADLAVMPSGALRNEGVDFDFDQFNRVLQLTVTSVAAVALGLRDRIRKGGSITVLTSSAGFEGAFATLSYNASKAAVHNLVKSLANLLGSSKGVRVNGVAPGWIPPSDSAAATGVVALADALTPSAVRGSASHVISAVLYLIENDFHNGDIISVDGGIESSYLPYLLEYLQLQGKLTDDELSALVRKLRDAKHKV